MIRFESVVVHYPGTTGHSRPQQPAAQHVNLHIEQGQLVVLLGPSGCGKTTTLKLINRLLEPTEGQIFVQSRPIAQGDPIALRRSIGYAAQASGLLPHWSIARNIGVVPRLLGWSQNKIANRVEQLLLLLGLPPEQFAARMPTQLSGGQQQRVVLARALAARPQILLLDEPLGALDPLTRDRLQGLLRRLHEELQLTTILVTHDVTEALLLADRVLIMKDGKVVSDATPANMVASPATPEIAEMLDTPRRQIEKLSQLWKATPV